MLNVNGRAFYDDNYPSQWRNEIPGTILFMTGSSNDIIYKYDSTL